MHKATKLIISKDELVDAINDYYGEGFPNDECKVEFDGETLTISYEGDY